MKYFRNLSLSIISKQILDRLLICLVVIGLLLGSTGVAQALTQDDINSIINQTPFYDSTATQCGNTSPADTTPTPTVSSAEQKQNIETIIGIDKTDNLGQAGALIGLMVALDESNLTNDANENVPLSEQNPNKQGDGSNGTSLGVFQQQITANWSTISESINSAAAINQLMTPAYAAEAFFGSPPGANVPGTALEKGLQNVAGWQTLDPWVAAQAVQQSADVTGSNYETFLPQATSYLNQYWATSPAIPLPVSITGGSSVSLQNQTLSSGCSSSVICNGADTTVSTADAASIRQAVVCIAEQELALWTSGAMTAGFRADPPSTDSFSKYSLNNNEAWCADFVSWVYNQASYPVSTAPGGRDASVEDIYNTGVQGTLFSYHAVSDDYTPQPGDLAIHYDPTQATPYYHVNIVVAVSGQTITLIGGDQGSEIVDNNVVSEYQDTSPSADNIIGYVTPN